MVPNKFSNPQTRASRARSEWMVIISNTLVYVFFLQYPWSSKKWISRKMDLGIFLGKLQYFTHLNELRPYWDDFPIPNHHSQGWVAFGLGRDQIYPDLWGISEESLPKKSIDHLERFGCHCHCCPFSNCHWSQEPWWCRSCPHQSDGKPTVLPPVPEFIYVKKNFGKRWNIYNPIPLIFFWFKKIEKPWFSREFLHNWDHLGCV